MKVELTVLETEITERTSWLQAALDVALDACRLLQALEDVTLARKLLLHPFLLLFLIDRESLAQLDQLVAAKVGLVPQQYGFRVACISNVEFVVLDDCNQCSGAHIGRRGEPLFKHDSGNTLPRLLHLVKCLHDCFFDLFIGLGILKILLQIRV